MRPEIDAYLREHGGRYTTETLRRQLIEAGHDPVEVDAALRDTKATRAGNRSGSGLNDAAWAMFLVGALLGAGGALLLIMFSGVVSGGPNLPLFVAIYAVAYLGLGYLVLRLVRWAATQVEIRGVGAVLLGIVLVPVYGALMLGTCAAASNLASRGGG